MSRPGIELTLPFPPTVNTYWRRHGHIIHVSMRGRQYRKEVISLVGGIEPYAGPIAVAVEVYPPDRRKRDLDNLLKSLLDSLAHAGAYHDDCQIQRLSIERRDVCEDGKAVVIINEL